MKKVCSACGKKKDEGDFDFDWTKPDHRRAMCKLCRSLAQEAYWKSEKGIAAQGRRNNVRQRLMESDESYADRRRDIVNKSQARPEVREEMRAFAQSERGLEKKRATNAVERAVKSGRIVVPTLCPRCEKDPGEDKLGRRKMRAVHINGYATENQLDIEWMCPTCVNRLTKVESLT